jgi:hypothetical protein
VTLERFPRADHLFIDGPGVPTPAEYAKAARLDPALIPEIVSWIHSVPGGSRETRRGRHA